MATNLPSCFPIEFLEQLLKLLVNFTLSKYVKSQRSYDFLITKEQIFGFQILDLKDHFTASLRNTENKLLKLTFMMTGWGGGLLQNYLLFCRELFLMWMIM